MGMYLVIFTDNHGEEFDVHGFKVMTEKEVNEFEELASSITWGFEYYANSESLYYSNGEDFLSRIDFKEISKDEFNMFKKIFGGEFGTFITEDYLKSILDIEAELDEEDDSEELDEIDEY